MDRLNTSDNIENNVQTEPFSTFIGIGVYMTIIFVLGSFEYACVFIVLVKYKPLPISNNIFIIVLAVIDISMIIIGFPFVIVSSLAGEWIFGEKGCVFYGFLMSFLGMSQIAILVTISIDKYLIIVKQNQAPSEELGRRILCTIGCFGFGMTTAIFPLLGWSSYDLEGLDIGCSVNWTGRTWSDISYSLSLMIIGWILPLFVILFCYGKILVFLRREARKPVRRNLNNTQRRKMNMETCVTITVFVMIGAFVLSWMPYSVVSLLAVFTDPGTLSRIITTLPALLAKTSVIWNPIIYVVRHNDFRVACAKILPAFLNLRYICSGCSIGNASRSVSPELTDTVYNRNIIGDQNIEMTEETIVMKEMPDFHVKPEAKEKDTLNPSSAFESNI